MNWIKINRDKWGFLADGMLEQMYGNLPIIVWDSKYEMVEYMDEHNWGDWLSDLEGKPYYSHYMQIVLPEEKKKNVDLTQEQINAMVHDSCVSFCKHCGCGVPRETCTSLGTCKEHDEYRAAIRTCLMEKNKKK